MVEMEDLGTIFKEVVENHMIIKSYEQIITVAIIILVPISTV